MRGRQILMESLIAQGVSYIFGNPGTTESPIIDSLLDYLQLNYIEALHEGVAVGAASYYAQASGKTGFVNVHVAPGLGNSIGMMYNALKASAPVVVTAGQQDTRMRLRDPLLGHDLVAMAAALGAAMWTEGIRMHASVPSSHPNFRLALGFDALSIRKALEGADVLLLVGGPFFEEVWFSPGSPFPTGAAVIQVETSSQRLAYNYGVKVGLIGDPKATLAARLVE